MQRSQFGYLMLVSGMFYHTPAYRFSSINSEIEDLDFVSRHTKPLKWDDLENSNGCLLIEPNLEKTIGAQDVR